MPYLHLDMRSKPSCKLHGHCIALPDTKKDEKYKVKEGFLLLTVCISKHNARALSAELQGHSLQIAFPSSLFDYFANLKRSITK